MRIAFIAKRPCVRLGKELNALVPLGHEITLIADGLDITKPYSNFIYCNQPGEFAQAIRLVKDKIDLFVVHNEPTWPVAIVREEAPEAKIVLDYHDSQYWYFPSQEEVMASNESVRWYEEDYSVAMCDGFVVPSDTCKEELKTRTDRPIVVLPPLCSRSEFRYQGLAWAGGLVSQGGHSIPGLYSRVAEHWRDYTKLYTYLNGKCGIFVYCPRVDEEVFKAHYAPLVTFLGKAVYDTLLDKLGEHSWNLVGNWTEHRVWQFSAPNKFYDALAAGVPSVVFNTQSIIDIIEEEKFGLIVNHPDELLAAWDSHSECRKNLMLKRSKYCMENFIGRVEDLYKTVIAQ